MKWSRPGRFGGFGNDPRDFYEVKPYYQFGEPRVYGISVSWSK